MQFLSIPEDRLSRLQFYTLLLVAACLFFSRYTLTVSLVFLLLVTLGGQFLHKRIRLASVAYFVLPAVLLVLYMISIYYSDSVAEGLAAMRAKTLFLVLPFTMLSLSMISFEQKKLFYHFFIFLTLITSAWSLIQIPVEHLHLQEIYARGQVIPTVVHHILFSMFGAFSAVCCWLLAFRRAAWRLTSPVVYGILAIYFTVFLHILAVRSGLAGFYGGMLFLVVLSFTNKRNIAAKTGLLLIVGVGIFAAYKWIPSLKSKIGYTFYSLKQYTGDNNGDIGLYSDSRRLISYEAAVELIREHPLTGVGIGDIKQEINAWYDIHYPQVDQDNLHPHNQYLFTAAAAGIPVALYLLAFNLLLLIRHIRARDWLLVAFNIILITSFLVEDMLETQLGVAVYLLFNYLGWDNLQPREDDLAKQSEA